MHCGWWQAGTTRMSCNSVENSGPDHLTLAVLSDKVQNNAEVHVILS
jgi:hypothetical protein